MKIDSFSRAGSIKKQSEDNFFTGENTFWVFDWASSLVPYKSPKWHTGGFLASEIAKNTLAEFGNIKNPQEIISIINLRIRSAMEHAGIDYQNKHNSWCTTAAIVQLKNNILSYAQITDAMIIVIYKNWTHSILWEDSNHDEPTLTEWKKLGDLTQIEKRKKVDWLIRKVRNTQNIDYWVLSWEEWYEKFLNTWEIEIENIAHVLLFTDGLIPPTLDPKDKPNYNTFVKKFLSWWISATHDWLFGLEESDPECIKYPRFKKHDDAAIISISF